MTTLGFFTISKNMLDPFNKAMFYDNFTLFSPCIDGFPVHVWVRILAIAGSRCEPGQLGASWAGVTMTSQVT